MVTASLEAYCAKAVELGATYAKVIDPATVVTAPWVRAKCQFGCENYGKYYVCPPHTPTPETTRHILDSYQKAILLHLQWTKGLQRGREIKSFLENAVALERELFLEGHYKAFSFLAGNCILCKECNVTKSLPCLFPRQARPSMEGCGIDVYQTAWNNSLPLKPVRSEEETRNIYGLVLVG